MLERTKRVFKDIRALVCYGGIRVDTLSSTKSTNIAIQSIIQLDGDVTTTVAKSEINNSNAISSHMDEIEYRLQSVAKCVRKVRFCVNGIVATIAATLTICGAIEVIDSIEVFDDFTLITFPLFSVIVLFVVFVILKSSFIPKHITAFVINVLSRKVLKQ